MHKGARCLGPCASLVAIMAAHQALSLKEGLEGTTVRFDANWSLSALDIWDVMVMTIIVFLAGFVLGYKFAAKIVEDRAQASVHAMMKTKTPRRTIGTQSMATYKRKSMTPRFHVLPQLADGVFDVTFSTIVDED